MRLCQLCDGEVGMVFMEGGRVCWSVRDCSRLAVWVAMRLSHRDE